MVIVLVKYNILPSNVVAENLWANVSAVKHGHYTKQKGVSYERQTFKPNLEQLSREVLN